MTDSLQLCPANVSLTTLSGGAFSWGTIFKIAP
jgi:hypothetical protein